MPYNPNEPSVFDGMTTVHPVARIVKISKENPAEIFVDPYDYGKLQKGSIIRISRQIDQRGRGLFDNKTFQVSSPDPEACSFLLEEGGTERGFDATSLDKDIEGGFAEVIGFSEVIKDPPPPEGSRSTKHVPPETRKVNVKVEEETPLRKDAKKDDYAKRT